MIKRSVLSLLSLTILLPVLAGAEARFSRQERDWAEQDRNDRIARTREAYRQVGAGQYSQIIFNSDGSITFTEPRLVRGPKQLPMDVSYSDKTGVCRLFGLQNNLSDTIEYAAQQYTTMAVVNSAGRYDQQLSAGNRITSISCSAQGAYAQTGTVEQVFENADGSITLLNPRIVRGTKQLPLDVSYSDKTGICRLFGFDDVLTNSTFYGAQQYTAMAVINSAGAYDQKLSAGNAITSISCAMRGDHRDTGFANKMKRNGDDSVTISNPRLIRGMLELPVDVSYSDKTGLCRLFGFQSYLQDSTEYSAQQYTKMAVINSAGRYDQELSAGNAVTSITCYSGRYKTTAIAGGYLFQDGEWMGQVRRSRSHWRSDVRSSGGEIRPKPPVADINR